MVRIQSGQGQKLQKKKVISWFKACVFPLLFLEDFFPFYWAVQAGLLTPWTFTQHLLSPLAGSNDKFAKFTLPTLKAFLKARS